MLLPEAATVLLSDQQLRSLGSLTYEWEQTPALLFQPTGLKS